MSASNQSAEFANEALLKGAIAENWYAVHTRARHERVVAQRLKDQGVTTFLPLVSEVHRWSDRQKTVELPLFGCYVFVKLPPTGDERLRVLQIDGVFRFVGIRGIGTPIAESQIDAVRTLIGQQVPWTAHPFLQIGQRVRVRGGSLDGVEGILVSRDQDNTLVISIDAIQRSLAVRIQGYDVEPV
jgi:transcription antitermination factor NusG